MLVHVRGLGLSTALQKRLQRVGNPCILETHVQRGAHYGGRPEVRLRGLRQDDAKPTTALADGGFRAFFPADQLEITDPNGNKVDLSWTDSPSVYSEIDKAVARQLQTSASTVRDLASDALTSIAKIGAELVKAKEALDHGQWERWVDEEFGWAKRTAERYMAVARAYPQLEHGHRYAANALYLLASPSTPEQAREMAANAAASGETITLARAQEIVRLHKEPSAPDLAAHVKKASRAATTVVKELEAWHAPKEVIDEARELVARLEALIEESRP